MMQLPAQNRNLIAVVAKNNELNIVSTSELAGAAHKGFGICVKQVLHHTKAGCPDTNLVECYYLYIDCKGKREHSPK
jgi:hypothetical protein